MVSVESYYRLPLPVHQGGGGVAKLPDLCEEIDRGARATDGRGPHAAGDRGSRATDV